MDRLPTAIELNAKFRELAGQAGLEVRSWPLRHRGGDFELLRLASKDIGPGDKVLLVRAGIHGDEVAGPLTLADRLPRLVEEARGRGVKLVVYPLGNPSGYAVGRRYNIDNDRGPCGNGDHLRYELPDGRLTDDLGAGGEFRRWLWSSDQEAKAALPLETAVMHAALRQEPIDRVAAVIDLHQDLLTPNAWPGAYFYAFGDLAPYRPLAAVTERLVPLLRRAAIGAGFGTAIDEAGRVVAGGEDAIMSDDDGFIVRHDGSLPDLCWRLGVRHCLTIETTGATPLPAAIEVNWLWLSGLIRLIAADG